MTSSLHNGDSLEVEVESLALGGDGVSRHLGQVIFTPFAAAGDRLQINIAEAHRSFARGKISAVLRPAPARENPPCPYYQDCGGCQYQHVSYAEELKWKETQIRETFQRLAKIVDAPVLPILSCPQAYGYRNRITVHSDGQRVGFHRANSRDIVDIDRCLIADDAVNTALGRLRATKPVAGHYSVRHPSLPPSAFFQVNHILLETLAQTVVSACASGGPRLIEGYCGGGFFTHLLAPRFEQVIAIENDARALRDAEKLGLENVTWHLGRVEDFLHGELQAGRAEKAVVLVDPPREGLGEMALRALTEYPAQQLVYVSCNPATLARDAQKLKDIYQLESVQPIDMFPRTAQIESVVKWKRLNA
jgi:23S rRNA (uracil1939-C5)-methyltransferase